METRPLFRSKLTRVESSTEKEAPKEYLGGAVDIPSVGLPFIFFRDGGLSLMTTNVQKVEELETDEHEMSKRVRFHTVNSQYELLKL